MHPCPTLTALAVVQVAELPLFPLRAGFRSGLHFTLPRVFANACGRIEFIIFLIMDWSFASGCSPPRLSTTQSPSATDSQCSVRRGLSPRCWCALSGARGELLAALCGPPSVAVESRQLRERPFDLSAEGVAATPEPASLKNL